MLVVKTKALIQTTNVVVRNEKAIFREDHPRFLDEKDVLLETKTLVETNHVVE
jgi:hypothetical protein